MNQDINREPTQSKQLLLICAASFLSALAVLFYMSYTLSGGWGFIEVRVAVAVTYNGSCCVSALTTSGVVMNS